MAGRQILLLFLAAATLGACTSVGPAAKEEVGAVTDPPGVAPAEPGFDAVGRAYQEYQELKEAHLEANCDQRRITPELVQRYEKAVRAMDVAGYGYGRNSNFAAVQHPRTAYVECAEDK